MTRFNFAILLFSVSALAGCFTVSETEYPVLPMTKIGSGENVNVAVSGFDATLTEYETVYGESLVYVPGFYGRHYYRPGYYQNVNTSVTMPVEKPTDMFKVKATERLEESGFNLKSSPADIDYIVEVRFSGPKSDNESMRALCLLFTCFLVDFDDATWFAKLKIYNSKTGKLEFAREYSQRYDVTSASIIPIFGPMYFEKTFESYMKAWCLHALTDQVTSEASAFMAAKSTSKAR